MLHDKLGNAVKCFDMVSYNDLWYIVYELEGKTYLFNDNELLKIDELDLTKLELIERFVGEWL